jgi:DNA polymerase-3 subunit delta'
MSAPAPRANPDFAGHPQALEALGRALGSGRCPHGWLLHGRKGVGKATLAYRFARALLAEPAAVGPDLHVDPDHPVARQVASGAHPDLRVLEVERDAKTGKLKSEIPVDAIRAATAAFHSTPAIAPRRVLLVDGAEQLNRNAANALLKPLEEPPGGAVLILVSHRPAQVAPTLRSRCAKLAFGGLPELLLRRLLAEQAPEAEPAAIEAALAVARGSLGQALALIEADWRAGYEALLRCVAAEPFDAYSAQELADQLAKRAGRAGLGATIGLVQELLGRIVALRTGRLGAPLVPAEASALELLAGRRPLDRWAALWEKIGQLSAAVDGLNLDPAHALLQIVTMMAQPSERDDDRRIGGAPLGGHHVLG